MKKYFVLGAALLFCNTSQAAVYMIDFKCDQEAYKVFATMTLDELDGQFLEGSKKLATEDLFTQKIQHMDGITQKYIEGLCPNAEFLQKRMICMKTNYWNLSEAEEQAVILKKTLKEFQKL